MPRFHLHLYDGLGLTADDEGTEVASLAAAREEAIRSIRSLVSEDAKGGRIDLSGRVEIVGEDGQSMGVVLFTDAVQLQAETVL